MDYTKDEVAFAIIPPEFIISVWSFHESKDYSVS